MNEAVEYEGLVTRMIAFAIDAAIISAVAVVVGAAAGISLSVLSVPDQVENIVFAAAGGICLLWSTAYFVTFWSTTGQTPGDRVLKIRVRLADDGSTLRPARALLRLIALTLAAIPLFAGFLPILFDDRRRGLHDMLAGTVVVGAAADVEVGVDRARASSVPRTAPTRPGRPPAAPSSPPPGPAPRTAGGP